MPTRTKKWWMIHVAAGVATVALIAIGVTQCSGKMAERAEKEAKESELATVNTYADSLSTQVQDMHEQIDGLKSDISERARTNDMLCDSIETLNDSLLIVNEELTDCRNSKRKPVKSQQKPQQKPQQKLAPVVTVKPDTIVIVQQAPVNPGCAGVTNISLNNSQNNGAIVAGGNPGKTDIKLDNGSVNNGAIVVGNGNNVVVNTPAAKAAVDTLNNVTVKRTIYIKCTVEREY